MSLTIKKPQLFNFQQCLTFLQRSEQELLYTVSENCMYKAINIGGENILFRLFDTEEHLRVKILHGRLSFESKQFLQQYVAQMFDLKRNIKPFYELGQTDPILQNLLHKYTGYRVIGIPNLFESLTWAIIGQQINLTFAYTLKKRFTEQFGKNIVWQGEKYWMFPEYEQIAKLNIEDLQTLQFSQRKAEYIIGIAKLFQSGTLCKERLSKLNNSALEKQLVNIRGVGEWTAHYVMMRTFNIPSAFPIADVGLHRALEKQLDVDKRPTIAEIKQLAKRWQGWEAYATFYLWRSLYD